MALASKVQAMVLAMRTVLIFGIAYKHQKDNKINNSYNNKLIISYV